MKPWKNRIFTILAICISANMAAQSGYNYKEVEPRRCITVGILQGGGSLIGADIEFLLTDRFGAQIGAGLVGFGAGLNYHLKPSIRSSFLSLQYWNQGIGNSFVQNLVGPSFVYRSEKWFTFQVGFGLPLEVGPAAPENYVQPDAMLTFAIGAFFPY
ncbi:MAG: hypothetical protein LC670_06120 [Flavobacteriales bacterium]|nr:hypothetical protein [Flavobacteriales bacterium]